MTNNNCLIFLDEQQALETVVHGSFKCTVPLDILGFPSGSMVKNPPTLAGDTGDGGSIPGLGRSPGGGHDNPLKYSCLENPVDRGACRSKVHGVTKNWTQLSD